jgi:hypothetical protein
MIGLVQGGVRRGPGGVKRGVKEGFRVGV